jgi:Leucine-rich repeat (LRR) protein
MSDDSLGNPKWEPSSVVCPITNELIYRQSGLRDLKKIEVLDLHIRDGSKGKIRKIENLAALVNLAQLNISYNAITRIEGLDQLLNLVELNLAENSIKRVR